MTEKKRYCVWYEKVDLETRRTEKVVLVKDVDFKTAHAIKRDHKKICAMHVSRWLTAA